MTKLYTHPDFNSQFSKLKEFDDIYIGDHTTMVASKYLPLHELENRKGVEGSERIRTTREGLSKYTNFPKRIINKYKAILFQKPFDIDDATKKYLESDEVDLINNFDGKGNSIYAFARNELFKDRAVYGVAFALVTSNDNDNAFVTCINPLSVKDWQIQNGKLSLFRYDYSVYSNRTSSSQEPTKITYSDEYALIDGKVFLTRWQAEKEGNDWKIKEQIELTNFIEIPVVSVFNESLLADSKADILSYHELKSSLLNQLYHQAFQKIFITGQISDSQKIAFAEYIATVIPSKDGAANATVVTIEPTNPVALISQLGTTEINIYKSAFHLNQMTAAGSKNVEGADTQSVNKEDFISAIKVEMGILEKQLTQLITLLGDQLGETLNPAVKFDYDQLSMLDFEQQLQDELAYMNDIRRIDKWYKAHLKKVSLRQNYSDDETIEIHKEIEQAPAQPTRLTPQVKVTPATPTITLNGSSDQEGGLSDQQIAAIKISNEKYIDLANRYNVSTSTISKIKNN